MSAPLLNATQLLELAQTGPDEACPTCSALICPGWESLPSVFNPNSLKLVGTLRNEAAEDTWDEFHPKGTEIWSKDAPIAIGYHPYNKCHVYQCTSCARLFLRYTEYGGYYVDERIRALNPHLIVT